MVENAAEKNKGIEKTPLVSKEDAEAFKMVNDALVDQALIGLQASTRQIERECRLMRIASEVADKEPDVFKRTEMLRKFVAGDFSSIEGLLESKE